MSNYLDKSKKYKGFHHSVLDVDSLTYLHNRTFEIFCQIKNILVKNNIQYMLCGGTLLGAYTLNDFIPWDDDFDMCIFEEDYDKAVDLLIENLPSDILVQCSKTESKYFHGWVKVRDVNSCVYPKTDSYSNNGVWVDLYKLTKLKSKTINYNIAKEHYNYLKRRFSVGDISYKEMKKRIKDNRLVGKLLVEFLKSMFSFNRNEIYMIWSASKIILDKEWVFPLKKLIFRNEEVLTFNMAEKYLLNHYGENFGKFPADELRRVGIDRVQIF